MLNKAVLSSVFGAVLIFSAGVGGIVYMRYNTAQNHGIETYDGEVRVTDSLIVDRPGERVRITVIIEIEDEVVLLDYLLEFGELDREKRDRTYFWPDTDYISIFIYLEVGEIEGNFSGSVSYEDQFTFDRLNETIRYELVTEKI